MEGTAPSKFGRAKTSKIRGDLGQFLTLTANISGMDIDKRSTALSPTILSALNKEIGELWFINTRDYAANVYLPKSTVRFLRILMPLI